MRPNPQRLSDGSLVYIEGTQPDQLEGYDVDERDSCVFRPAWKPCIFRTMKESRMHPCGKMKYGTFCTKLNAPFVTRNICYACPYRQEQA